MLVADQQQILLAWLVVGTLLLGLGLAARAPLECAADLWTAFWVGFASLLTLLQLWHLVLPIDDRARIALGVLGAAGLMARGARPWRLLLLALRRHLPTLLATLGATWWLSNRCLAAAYHGDTWSYLVPTTRWLETYPIVPGLANLYVPLGHNYSYLLYVSLLDTGPFARQFAHVVNGMLLLPLFARAALAAVRLLRRSGAASAVEVYYLAILPAVTELACGILLTSPTPDFAVHVLGFVLVGELLALVTTAAPSRAQYLVVVFLAGAALTAKASLLVLAATIIAVASWSWWRRARPPAATLLGTLMVAALIAGLPALTWVARNVVTSGYPLYPSQLGAFPVEWRASSDAVAWIQRPMEFPLRTFWADPHWAYDRLVNLGWWDQEVRLPATLFAIALLVAPTAWMIRRWRGTTAGAVTPLVLVPPLLSFAFVFTNTPMPKYQGAILWVIPLVLLLVGGAGACAAAPRWMRAGLVALVLVTAAAMLRRTESVLLPLPGFEPIPRAAAEPRELPSGLVVNVPTVADMCGHAPLPCTPEPNPGLRLRYPDDLGGGFMIRAEGAE